MKKSFSICLALLAPLFMFAHHKGGGLVGGIIHPIFSLSHFLAIFCIAMFASQKKGNSRRITYIAWVVPFLLAAKLGFDSSAIALMHPIIALSVIIFGVYLWKNKQFSYHSFILLVILFAFYHGYEHGVYSPGGFSLFYMLGMAIGARIIFWLSASLFEFFNTGQARDKNIAAVGLISMVLGVILLIF